MPSTAQAGIYINTATASASNFGSISDTAALDIRIGQVGGVSVGPVLTITKEVSVPVARPGDSLLYTVVLKNQGAATATNLLIMDALPSGIQAISGDSMLAWSLPTLAPGEEWRQLFLVLVAPTAVVGEYTNTVTAGADNHPAVSASATVQVILGISELPTTGEMGLTSGEIRYDIASAANKLVIPKIGVEVSIVEGATEQALSKGAWRLPGTSTPDQGGNIALAGHRFRYEAPYPHIFYLLDKLEQGDTFKIAWEGKEYHYAVSEISIVQPDDLSILQQTQNSTVTLITCTPLFSAERRLVVRAELIR